MIRTTLRPSSAADSTASSEWKIAASTRRIYLVGFPGDDEVGEVRRALAELPPATHVRPHERGAPAVDERDHRDALGDGVPVGLVKPFEAAAVASFLPRGLDQLVEDGIGEAALVRPARRLEEQAEVVLRIGIARQPACDPNRSGLDPLADLYRLCLL